LRPPIGNLATAAWGDHPGSGATVGGKAGQGQAGLPPRPAKFGGPLEILLSRYPSLDAPGITNVSMKHMQGHGEAGQHVSRNGLRAA
jgi:hypothetical protein